MSPAGLCREKPMSPLPLHWWHPSYKLDVVAELVRQLAYIHRIWVEIQTCPFEDIVVEDLGPLHDDAMYRAAELFEQLKT